MTNTSARERSKRLIRSATRSDLLATIEAFAESGNDGEYRGAPESAVLVADPGLVPIGASHDFGGVDPGPDEASIRRMLAQSERIAARLSDSRVTATSVADRQYYCLRAGMHLAYAALPCYAAAGRYDLALSAAESLLGRLTNRSHRDVPGAGNGGGDPVGRHLAFTPVGWSLALHYPL